MCSAALPGRDGKGGVYLQDRQGKLTRRDLVKAGYNWQLTPWLGRRPEPRLNPVEMFEEAMGVGSEILVRRENRVGYLVLNRPEVRNAFNVQMVRSWAETLRELNEDESVNVIVVTGAGGVFCAGGDLAEIERNAQGNSRERKNFLWEEVYRIPLALEGIDKPVIASIDGVAYGAGLDMALMCDIRIASTRATFCEAYVRVGLVPGDGGAYYLPRLVGVAKALELFWTGMVIDAQEALRLGLVNRVVPTELLEPATRELAESIANGPTVAIRFTKRAVYQAGRMDLRSHLDSISSAMSIVLETEDVREAIRAFKEKRNPHFQGK